MEGVENSSQDKGGCVSQTHTSQRAWTSVFQETGARARTAKRRDVSHPPGSGHALKGARGFTRSSGPPSAILPIAINPQPEAYQPISKMGKH